MRPDDPLAAKGAAGSVKRQRPCVGKSCDLDAAICALLPATGTAESAIELSLSERLMLIGAVRPVGLGSRPVPA